MLRERKSSQKDFGGWLIPWRVFLNCLDFLMKRDSFPKKIAKKTLGQLMICHHFSKLNHDELGPNLPAFTKDLNFRPLGTGILLVTVLIVTCRQLMLVPYEKRLVRRSNMWNFKDMFFLFNFYPKTWGKHDSNLTCAYFLYLFFNGLAWHILNLVKYPIGSMGLVYYTYLHLP